MDQHSLLTEASPHEGLLIDAWLSGVGEASALFLCSIFDAIKDRELSARDIADECGLSTTSALYHLKRLKIKNYIKRTSHVSWTLGENALPENRRFEVKIIKIEKKKEESGDFALKTFTKERKGQPLLVL